MLQKLIQFLEMQTSVLVMISYSMETHPEVILLTKKHTTTGRIRNLTLHRRSIKVHMSSSKIESERSLEIPKVTMNSYPDLIITERRIQQESIYSEEKGLKT